MTPLRRIKLTKLNRHLVCPLCNGYFVEATTITECLHTFCKTCIVGYLNSSSFCPVCDVQVHKTKPTCGLREDKTLQDVVFKLVPDLFRNEMDRRTEFYKQHPEAGGDKTEQSLKERRHFFHVDDQISLSLEFLPPAHAHAHALGLRPLRAPFVSQAPASLKDNKNEKKEENNNNSSKESGEEGGDGTKCGRSKEDQENAKTEEQKVEIPIRRYLKCPAAVQIRLLEKFIRLKYGLSAHHRVDIVHGGDCLSPELTLLDVVYMYKWTEDNPLNLQYTVIAPPLPLRKRPRSQSSKIRTYFPEGSPKKKKGGTDSSKISPKKFKAEEIESNKSVSSSPNKETNKSNNNLTLNTVTKEEDDKDKSTVEGTNSLNSSRDEADDAMVIDEGVSDSSNTMDVDTANSSPVVEVDAQKLEKTDLENELQKSCPKSNFSIASDSSSASSSKDSILLEQKSSIESLKALVNSSSYSGFPTKPTQLKPNSSFVSSNNHKMIAEPQSSQARKLQNQPNMSNVENHSESCVSLASGTKIANTMVSCDTSVTSLSFNKPDILSTSYSDPDILTTICMSEGIGLPAIPANPTISTSSINISTASRTSVNSTLSSTNVHTSLNNTQSITVSAPMNVVKCESPRPSLSNTGITNQRVSSADILSNDKVVNTTSASFPQMTRESGSPGLSSKSAVVSRSSSFPVSKFNQVVQSPKAAVIVSSTATPASTSLTPAIKTPLASSTPSSTLQSFPVSSIPDNSVSHKPSQPSTPRSLISNSYRNPLAINNGLKINGIMPAPRPILDPTKPRLGRPPNSARIAAAAAGRVGPQLILPRGASPREIFNPKSVGNVKGEGRGRPKAHGVTGSGRVPMNSVSGPQQSTMSVGKNMSLSQSNNHSHIPQSTTDLSVLGRESLGNVMNTSTSNLSEAVTHNFNKKIMPKNNNNNANVTKGISTSNPLSSVNNFKNKINKKLEPEHNPSSPSTNLHKSLVLNSPKGNPSSQTKPSSVSNMPAMKAVKSPNRTKSSNGNSSSILSIAQNLANKQLQQISHADSALSTGSVPTGSSAISSATVAAAAAAALGPQFNAALGLSNVSPSFCAAYMAANYNLLLSQAAAARSLSQASLQDQSKKHDACPMDLSPSNKTSQSSPINSNQIAKVKGSSSSSKKSPQHTKPSPLLSPQNNVYASPAPPISKASKSPPVSSSVLQTSTISPPTPEVTITKLPNTSTESSSTSSSTSSTKPSHTNTVSITKRPSVTSSSSSSNGVATPKFGVTRSPSNASVRQIPNPSLLSHQSDVRNSSSTKGTKMTNQNMQYSVTNNNNSSNKNNNNKLTKVDS